MSPPTEETLNEVLTILDVVSSFGKGVDLELALANKGVAREDVDTLLELRDGVPNSISVSSDEDEELFPAKSKSSLFGVRMYLELSTKGLLTEFLKRFTPVWISAMTLEYYKIGYPKKYLIRECHVRLIGFASTIR